MEEDIKIVKDIIETLEEHIEFEDYEQDVLEECKRDIKVLKNILKVNEEMSETIKLLKERVGNNYEEN